MTYNEALNFILNKQSLGIKPGLKRIKKALLSINNPQDDYKTIHIAGTNGKGTVAATVAKAISDNGYKVGLFTSPWITDYREQIQINGEMISESEFTDLVEKLMPSLSECTEFECICVIAFMYFKMNSIDYAVIECGMGGRGDATNVEKENLSVITSISLDHTDYLGDTVEEIAKEKAGILRKNCTSVLSDESLKEIFEPECSKLLSGFKDNLSLTNAVLGELGINSVNELVKLPARCEKIGNILLDGGHNVSAAKMLEPLTNNETAVIGMMKDKDVDGYLSLIAPKCKKIYAVTVNHYRSMSANELAKIAKKYCNDVEIIENPIEAVNKEGITLICGSLYLAREVRKILI